MADGWQLPFSAACNPAPWAFDTDQNIKSLSPCPKSEIDRATIYEAARWEKLLEVNKPEEPYSVPLSITLDVLRGAW